MINYVSIIIGALALLTCSFPSQRGEVKPLWSVTGEVDLGDSPPLKDATLHVHLVETLEDVPERTIAHMAVFHLDTSPASKRPKFLLEVGDLGPKGYYQVRVHLDLDRDGEISEGDLISTEACPVFQRGNRETLVIKASKV